MKKLYNNPEMTITEYVNVIAMSGETTDPLLDKDNIGNLGSDWKTK